MLNEQIPKSISQMLQLTMGQLTIASNKISTDNDNYRGIINESVRVMIKRCTQPQLQHFLLQKGSNVNLYPVFGIVAWRDIQIKQSIINWQLCQWVESGGARCVPINQVPLFEEKNRLMIKQQLRNIHALIIPSVVSNPSATTLQFLQTLLQLIKQSQHPQLNVLSFGKASSLILNKYYEKLFLKQSQTQKQQQQLLQKAKLNSLNQPSCRAVEGKIVSILQKGLFSTIDVGVQMKGLLKEIPYSSIDLHNVNWPVLTQHNATLQVESFILIKTQKDPLQYQLFPYFFKQEITKTITIYHSFIELYTINKHGKSIFNKLIVNFVDSTKKIQHKIKNPVNQIGHYPLEFKGTPQKAYYKIATIK